MKQQRVTRPIYCVDMTFRHVKGFAALVETGCGRKAVAFQFHEVWYEAGDCTSCQYPKAHWHAFKRARCGLHIDKSWPAWAATQPNIRGFKQIPVDGAEVYR